MIFHVARINVVSVANAFQQHFTGKHLEQMRVRERRFNRGIHALVQRADHTGIHKVVAPQQFPYLVQTLHGSAHLGNRYVSPIRAAFTSAGQQRVYGTMQYRSQIGKQGNVRQRLPSLPVGYRLRGDAQPFAQLRLRQSFLLSSVLNKIPDLYSLYVSSICV